jgi:hypothetical protein
VSLLLATVLDLGILWVVHHGDNSQWEFSAVATTLDQYPLIMVGLAALAGGFYLRPVPLTSGTGLVAVLCLLGAFVALVLGLLMAMDYLALRKAVGDEGRRAFTASAIKGGFLAALYAVTLGLAAWRGFKRGP